MVGCLVSVCLVGTFTFIGMCEASAVVCPFLMCIVIFGWFSDWFGCVMWYRCGCKVWCLVCSHITKQGAQLLCLVGMCVVGCTLGCRHASRYPRFEISQAASKHLKQAVQTGGPVENSRGVQCGPSSNKHVSKLW